MNKNFRLQVIIRILLLIATAIGGILLWFKTPFYLSVVLVFLILVYQTFRLIDFVEQTNRKLSRFLDSIRHSDFSRSFSGPELGSSFEQLNESFQEVVKAFEEQRMEKQAQFRYMQTIVEHVDVGLLSFTPQGDVRLLNAAAKRLFDVPGLHQINALKDISPALLDTVKKINDEDREVVHISINKKSLQLAIRTSVFRLRGEQFKLVSFQDINPELEEQEMESWQKITRVLAHEIMNSVTPIASLSETVQMLLQSNIKKNKQGYIIDREAVGDVSDALDTIETRSEGLIRFVNAYRDFTKVPELEVKRFAVNDMLKRIKNLNKGLAQEQHTTIRIAVKPETLKLTADPDLIEQVLINLTKNAFRALKDHPDATVSLHGEMGLRGRVRISVSDNGPGIPPENLEKIFIPFYSTQRPYKQGGSGIGLSLSRQIMRAHGGTLTAQSTRGQATIFTMQF